MHLWQNLEMRERIQRVLIACKNTRNIQNKELVIKIDMNLHMFMKMKI